jgi:hypothetical protein
MDFYMSPGKPMPEAKTYASPSLSKLTPEQAKLLLKSQAAQGNKDAKDLLNLLSQASKEI